MIDKRNIAFALSCVILSSLGCKTTEVLTTKFASFKNQTQAEKDAATKSIEASLRKMSASRNSDSSGSGQAKSRQSTPVETQKSASISNKHVTARLVSHETEAANDTARFQSPQSIQSSYPIDFPTVLRLAGADNWSVKLAQQRVREANANYCAAKSAWMPSLTLSIGYNHHDGEIQSTEGDVLSVSRSSLFLGGGAGVANSPLNGGSGGPPRMFVDFSLADAIFKPLSARRLLGAEQARQNRVFNDTMLEASLAYYELVGAQSKLAVAQTNLTEAQNLAETTRAFVESGKGASADNSRVAVVVNNRRQETAIAKTEVQIASSRLATILQLDPTKLNPEHGLVALDAEPIPLNLTGTDFDLNATIQHAQNIRCEIAEANAKSRSAHADLNAEQWRPWLPNLYVGYSGGVFGGGQGSDLPNLDGRSDLDMVVSWQVKNLGVGTRAQQDATRSQMYQRRFETQQIKDQIAEQVTTTYQRVVQFQLMVEILRDSVNQAGNGLENNLAAIKGLEGLPLEAIASLEQLANARTEYLSAVVNYNQWQVRLLRAAGQSLGADSAYGASANCNASGCDVAVGDCPACFEKPSRCRCNQTRPLDNSTQEPAWHEASSVSETFRR